MAGAFGAARVRVARADVVIFRHGLHVRFGAGSGPPASGVSGRVTHLGASGHFSGFGSAAAVAASRLGISRDGLDIGVKRGGNDPESEEQPEPGEAT